jgi:2-polyprenylphenol 6-hydroxylase
MYHDPSFDVAIVGAGVVGLTLAALLAKAEMRVIVFERGVIPAFDMASTEQRVSAITLASEKIFRYLGVWESLVAQRISAFQKMCVWEHQQKSHIHFDCATLPHDHLGHIVENTLMQSVLYQHCQQQAHIKILTECVLHDVQVTADNVKLFNDQGQHWTANLAVAADGIHSWLREKMQFSMKQRDYQHHALVTTVNTEHVHQKIAWQCFLPQGTLAFLPLRDPHQCSIVWSSAPEHIHDLMQSDETTFKNALTDVFEHHLGEIKFCHQRLSFPLAMRHTDQYVKPRIALVGDAAHSIHPLAGQGMNLGLWDAAILAETVINTYQQHRDFSLEYYLRQYQRRRQQDNRMMLIAMDGFKWAFTSRKPVVQTVRRLGLRITDRILPLKHQFMRRAMGLVGDLPAIVNEQR